MGVVIKDLLALPEVVPVGRGDLSVRGLHLKNISKLLETYRGELAQFFVNDVFDAPLMIATAPQLAVDIIAMASDSEGQEDDIERIPVASQIELLLTIWKLSVPDVKKLRESLLEAVTTLSAVNRAPVESVISTLPSESPSPNVLSS
jgi:hypothetical protein